MKRISLFGKTWIVIFFSLLLTGLIFVLSYSFLAQKSYEQEQTNKLKEYKQMLSDEISQYGIREKALAQYPLHGCFISIAEGEQHIYPATDEGFIYNTDNPSLLDENVLIENSTGKQLSEKFDVEYKNHTYTVTLLIPRVAYAYSTFEDFVPTFLGVGLIATGLISLLYSLYFSRRIGRLNKKILLMSKMEYQVNENIKNGDELVELEQHLNAMYLQLRKALNDRVFFTRGATHELKTPIMAVTSMLEGMMWNVEGFENREHYLQECYLQMESMTKLVNEILNLSQVEQLQEGTANIYKVVMELNALYEVIAKDNGCQISITCERKDMQVNMLEQNLNKVLSNLLSNALKYAPENSVISINITDDAFSISNQYEGLEAADIKDLCNPFAQGANAKEGHGLGLYIVKTILDSAEMDMECLIEKGMFTVKFRTKPTPVNGV